jgi:hypothetical protein
MNMENGEYYTVAEIDEDYNIPRLILGYILHGKRVEIYKSKETYIVVNTQTEKYLTCIGYEHAHYVFKECVRVLAPEGRA